MKLIVGRTEEEKNRILGTVDVGGMRTSPSSSDMWSDIRVVSLTLYGNLHITLTKSCNS